MGSDTVIVTACAAETVSARIDIVAMSLWQQCRRDIMLSVAIPCLSPGAAV